MFLLRTMLVRPSSGRLFSGKLFQVLLPMITAFPAVRFWKWPLIAAHCQPIGKPIDTDYVAVASRFLETPYLWGGRSGFGIDCSGLVQLAMMMTGRAAPRDSDMQASRLGTPIERDALQRGDLVFWKGHVGIMEDDKTLLHANGHTMTVARENLEDAIKRIGWLYDAPTGFRRP